MPNEETEINTQYGLEQLKTEVLKTSGGIKKYQRLLIIVLLAVAGLGSGAAYYFYAKFNQLKFNPQKLVQEESKSLIEQVGRLILLPTDEQPTIATVADPDRLKDQAFFANAKRGDKVLIYTNARKAILYDPIANKIVEVAPLNIGTAAGATTPEQPETED